VAELLRDFILGMIAGLLTTLHMMRNSGEQEAAAKLKNLKKWMQRSNLPKGFARRITEYCAELWNNRSGFEVKGDTATGRWRASTARPPVSFV
jgi:hypothetical protein